jgi:hypothetical protein
VHTNSNGNGPALGRGRVADFNDCRELAILVALARPLLARLLLALLARTLPAAALLLPAAALLATLAGLLLLLTRTRVVLLVRVLVGIGHSDYSSRVVRGECPV